MAKHFEVEDHEVGGTPWVAIRARGADWSWLTPDEAGQLGKELMRRQNASQEAGE